MCAPVFQRHALEVQAMAGRGALLEVLDLGLEAADRVRGLDPETKVLLGPEPDEDLKALRRREHRRVGRVVVRDVRPNSAPFRARCRPPCSPSRRLPKDGPSRSSRCRPSRSPSQKTKEGKKEKWKNETTEKGKRKNMNIWKIEERKHEK